MTCVAPTKAFNIAGLHTAAIIVPDENLRHKMWRGINTDEVGEGNCFSSIAAVSAFTEEGGEWLDALREYLWENRRFAEEYIREHIPQIRTVPSDATYLMWVDCTAVTGDSDEFVDYLEKEVQLMLNAGSGFGGNGKTFVRINLACPRSRIEEGLRRLEKGVKSLRS